MNCFGCGIEKDTGDSNSPLSVLECQEFIGGGGQWKIVVVCNECFNRLDPDMWISKNCWDKLSPKISFDLLPSCEDFSDEKRWNPETYSDTILIKN